jgi:hypothetical protein
MLAGKEELTMASLQDEWSALLSQPIFSVGFVSRHRDFPKDRRGVMDSTCDGVWRRAEYEPVAKSHKSGLFSRWEKSENGINGSHQKT